MIDIVTVVFRDELLVLQAQAQSIDTYCKNLNIGSIYVVVNDDDNVALQIDHTWWGQFSNCVTVVPRSVFSTNWSTNGWVSQQVLKLKAAATSSAEYSMILDAKTIFVCDLVTEQLINAQGQIQTGQLEVYPVFEPSRQIVNQLFDIELTQQAGPGGVPFVVANNAVRDMIVEVCDRTGQEFVHWFQAQGRVTEFILYSGYVVKTQGSLESAYSTQNQIGNIVNVCHSEVESWDRKFAEMQQSRTLTVSVHRQAWTRLLPLQREQYRQFLISRKILKASDL